MAARKSPMLSLLCIVLAACGGAQEPSSASPSQPDPRQVTLRFAWPDDLRLAVTETKETQRSVRGRYQDTPSKTTHYEMVATPRDRGLFIGHRNFSIQGLAPSAQILAQLGELIPDYTLDNEGQMVSFELDETAAAELDGVISPDAMSRESLEPWIRFQWSALPGFWSGRTLERGRGEDALLFGASEGAGRVTWIGFVECPHRASGEGERCVHLKYVQEWAEGSSSPMIVPMNDNLRQEMDLEIHPLREDVVVNLISEASTLIPHRMAREHSIEWEMTAPEQETVRMEYRRASEVDYVQVPSISNGLPTASEPLETMRWRFEAYNAALDVRDGELASALVSSSSVDFYERARRAALETPRDELETMPFMFRLTALLLRHSISPPQLRAMDGRAVIERSVRSGWSGSMGLEIISIRIDDHQAYVTLEDESGRDEVLLFVRERHQWLLDLTPLLDMGGLLMEEALVQSELTEEEFLNEVIRLMTGSVPSGSVWDLP